MSLTIIRELTAAGCPAEAAIFDFDGTISTLRCGWEAVMERVMLRFLRESGLPEEELLSRIRAYIEESTGIQTIFQMEWLAEQVRVLCGKTPADPWEYKDEYNRELLSMVNGRIARLESGQADPADFLVEGSREYLHLLREKGVKIYIASGTDDADLHHEAELLGIAPLVTEIRGAPPRRKDCSKEAVIRGLVGSGGYTGDRLLVAGDGKVEILLGGEAGAITIGVASREIRGDDSFHPKKLGKLRRAGARYLVPHFGPLVEQWNLGGELPPEE